MPSHRVHDAPYYRCRFPAEYALANRVQRPLNVSLREDAIIGHVDEWLAREFALQRLSLTIRDLVAAQEASGAPSPTSKRSSARSPGAAASLPGTAPRLTQEQHRVITLKPGLVPHMRPGGRRPPQAGQMLLAPGPPELPDRHERLRPQPRPCSRQLAALSPVRVEITQLELRVGLPGPCPFALPHRSRSVSCGHVVRKL